MPLPSPFTADLKVLVLAGANWVPAGDLDEASHEAEDETPLEAKSFVHIRDKLVIEYVLDWITQVGLRQIWVLAPEQCLELIPDHYDFHPVPQRPGASLGANLRHG